MRAIVISHPGLPDVLQLREALAPEPGAGQVRVRVHASGVNRADLLQRRGAYPAPPGWPQHIPGLEYAGVIDTLGARTRRFAVGDRVMGLVGGGGYAEQVVADEAEVMPVPASLSLEAAAAIPEAFLTAHDALYTQMRLAAGEWLLIHAVGSGVGTAGLQLARAAGARVLGTGRTRWKLDRARELGLPVAIDASTPDAWVEPVLHETGGRGVDGVLDLVGGAYLPGDIKAMARLGRLVIVGLVAGSSATLDLGAVLRKRLRIYGTALRSRAPEEKAEAVAAFARDALPLFDQHRLRPVVDRVFPAADAAEAHRRMEKNENFGKIVLTWT
jgi:putative PIG3 family NAD(P)H quinone oxidoreductase